MNLVLDASAGVEFVLDSTLSRELHERVPREARWWVPEHYFIEVAAALRRGEHRTVITTSQADAAFGRLLSGGLHRAQLRPLLVEAWSRRGHLTIADAVYVVLAEHLDATLVTTDLKLARSPGLSIQTITPTTQ